MPDNLALHACVCVEIIPPPYPNPALLPQLEEYEVDHSTTLTEQGVTQ